MPNEDVEMGSPLVLLEGPSSEICGSMGGDPVGDTHGRLDGDLACRILGFGLDLLLGVVDLLTKLFSRGPYMSGLAKEFVESGPEDNGLAEEEMNEEFCREFEGLNQGLVLTKPHGVG